MKYFDIARFAVDPKLSKRLGYARILSPDQVAVEGTPRGSKPYVLLSGDPGHLHKGLKDPNCIGVSITSSTLIKKTLEQARETEKPLFFIAAEFTTAEGPNLLRNLGRAQLLYKFALKGHVSTGLISLAADPTGLCSAAQMVQIARTLGADEAQAKAMLGIVGESHDH